MSNLATVGEKAAVGRTRGRPRTEDAAEIESVLLGAALREFLGKGYDGASMRAIAKAANVARTTLQGRYPTKEDLFRAIMSQQIERMSAITSLQFDGPPQLREGLVAYANRALSYSLEGEYLEVNRLIYASAHRFPELAAAARQSTLVGITQISEFIRECAVAVGVPCLAPEVPAECFILLVRGWYGYAMVDEDLVSTDAREQWVGRMVDTLLAGRAGW